MQIRIRDDDVLVPTGTYSSSLGRFQQVHKWIVGAQPKTVHVCGFIIRYMEDEFRSTVPFFRDEILAGRIEAQFHGYDHIDYKPLRVPEIREHLRRGKDFMAQNFGVLPTQFITPWGANAPHIAEACQREGMEMRDVSNIYHLKDVVYRLRDKWAPLAAFGDKDILTHWWEGGARIARLCAVAKYGSWDEAKAHDPQLFR